MSYPDASGEVSNPKKRMKLQTLLKALFIPLVILAFSLSYQILWEILGWPKGDELVEVVTDFFTKYGLLMVFACSVLESAVVIGNYFPGGIVIFLGVISAGHNIPRVILTVAIVSLGFCLGYIIDYFLGKYGWYKLLVKFGMRRQLQVAQEKVARHSFKAIALSYWEVNLASITATAAGILQINFYKFFVESLIGVVVWNIFWGTLVASLGKNALQLLLNWRYIIPIIGVWILVIVISEYFKSKKNGNQQTNI